MTRALDDELVDPDLPRRSPRGRPSGKDEDRRPDRARVENRPASDVSLQDLPGTVYFIPNRWWGFSHAQSADHPGACVGYRDQTATATLVKGTDPFSARATRGRVWVVAPTAGNGLSKPTAFEVAPRYFGLHRIRLLYPERVLGRLDPDDLSGLIAELQRLFPMPEGWSS